jgi:Ca2+-binding EF-hand superfamily protein
VKEEQKAIDKGKNKGANVEWSGNSSIEFSHKLTDGSEKALNELVEKIYSKYDLDGNGKLSLEQAMPFIKQFCKDEMEMDSVGMDLIEDTWGEIDEDQKGFVEKEDMLKYL